MSDQNVNEVMEAIEGQMVIAEIEKRGIIACAVAHVAGLVMTEARKGGLPKAVAVKMARDYWDSEMAPVEVYQLTGEAE